MTDTNGIERQRLRIRVRGLVQGVGFRPFVYKLAQDLGLAGHVNNDDEGVRIEVEGPSTLLSEFLSRLESDTPPLAAIRRVESATIDRRYEVAFAIEASIRSRTPVTQISPDMSLCDACLGEIFDPSDRRYRYPFTNCTNCGPRYTIVEHIPYDRPLTSMRVFEMCPDCRREYDDPTDRRFHAQPNACPECGPQVTLRDGRGDLMEVDDPILEAVRLLKSGSILAIRGLGGFHLAVDPQNDHAVRLLRERKGRAEKPFALMAPDVGVVSRFCVVTQEEEAALLDQRRPIVLLQARSNHPLPPSIAPGNRDLGFMLAYTPMHHLLLRDHFEALVMTSANRSEEPIAIGNDEAFERLDGIADYFLTHDREILQRCDDSIVRVIQEHRSVIRRSRGYVPAPVPLTTPVTKPILACGGELKNTVGLARDDTVLLSQHIGDLDNPAAYGFFEASIEHLESTLEIEPQVIAYDLHPEYLSTKWAKRQKGLELIGVQHHHAHLAAVMAENDVESETIGIILDGTGYGTDGTIWGGEVLVGDYASFERFAWLAPFQLPGGTAAIRHPWRIGLALLKETCGDCAASVEMPGLLSISTEARDLVLQMMDKQINSPRSSSCGRLFDGVSALLGLCRRVTFEAQAAIALEMVAASNRHSRNEGVGFVYPQSGPLSWLHIIDEIVCDVRGAIPISVVAARFHARLADVFVGAAIAARDERGINTVGLSGGVFQNQLLFDLVHEKLSTRGFNVITHRLVPTNDGGLAYGQVVVAGAQGGHRALEKTRTELIQTAAKPCV